MLQGAVVKREFPSEARVRSRLWLASWAAEHAASLSLLLLLLQRLHSWWVQVKTAETKKRHEETAPHLYHRQHIPRRPFAPSHTVSRPSQRVLRPSPNSPLHPRPPSAAAHTSAALFLPAPRTTALYTDIHHLSPALIRLLVYRTSIPSLRTTTTLIHHPGLSLSSTAPPPNIHRLDTCFGQFAFFIIATLA
ncbi:hypothetical protein Q7P37_009458 [Cladosporium fusiforme]